MTIERCICTNRTFEELLRIARRERLTLNQLAEKTGCGLGCGWCVSYLRCAYRTGQTLFHEMKEKEALTSEDERLPFE